MLLLLQQQLLLLLLMLLLLLHVGEFTSPFTYALKKYTSVDILCLFVLLLYVPSQQPAMVMAGRSVHLTTIFLEQA